jgi:hypothetical protein
VVECRPARLVGERPAGVVGPGTRSQMAGNGGSEMLIFVRRAAHSDSRAAAQSLQANSWLFACRINTRPNPLRGAARYCERELESVQPLVDRRG